MKFFIVDDDHEIVNLMTLVLEAEGNEVRSCVAGEEALSQIADMRPDCVITDLMMASLDGLEVCDEIRSNPDLKNTKIIMISARDAEHWQQKSLDHGAIGYIRKPIDVLTFGDVVTEMVA
ncbi:MAG: response regulator [Rhodospirillales bacterium]|nr:response regulator [Rhodospirillales bacterium]